MNTAEWATSVGIQPVVSAEYPTFAEFSRAFRLAHRQFICEHGIDCDYALADHPLPSPHYESLPPTHKPADDGEWASGRDMDAAGDRYFEIREPS